MRNLRILYKELKVYQKKKIISLLILKKFFEAKAEGYDPKIMRKILALRKMDVDERLEQEALLNTYKNALGVY